MTTTELPIYQIDAFTDEPFRGNPAAVCLLEREREAGWMQKVATEMNLSETAFLLPVGDGFQIRWFTPAIEVPLCGHATLASAHVLWLAGKARGDEIRFQSKSGPLHAYRTDNGIELDFPRHSSEPAKLDPDVAKAIGATPKEVHTVVSDSKDNTTYLLELASEQAVRDLVVAFDALRHPEAPGVLVTARADDGDYDFVSRYFVPYAGIDEDPVTGSAHCVLGPYWAERLGKDDLRAYQASARGGALTVRLTGDRVRLGGRAVTVLRGSLLA